MNDWRFASVESCRFDARFLVAPELARFGWRLIAALLLVKRVTHRVPEPVKLCGLTTGMRVPPERNCGERLIPVKLLPLKCAPPSAFGAAREPPPAKPPK